MPFLYVPFWCLEGGWEDVVSVMGGGEGGREGGHKVPRTIPDPLQEADAARFHPMEAWGEAGDQGPSTPS